MNALVHDFPAPPKQPEQVKKRTITITNRAPVTINEDEWPIIAESCWGDPAYDFGAAPWEWSIKMKVRQRADAQKCHDWQVTAIVHAVYEIRDETREENLDVNHTVRVGRLITGFGGESYYKQIREVGEELRERIVNERLKKYVTQVVDGVFSKLPATPVV